MASTRTLLSIAPNLKLPEEAVTETFAILGKRGSGKTTTTRVLTEELLHVGLPALILDPTGVWWGLRASADGAGDGYPVIIFGGDHADVPLEETSGSLIADVVVTRRISAVLDLSGLSKSGTRRFCTDLLERLYHPRSAGYRIGSCAGARAARTGRTPTCLLIICGGWTSRACRRRRSDCRTCSGTWRRWARSSAARSASRGAAASDRTGRAPCGPPPRA